MYLVSVYSWKGPEFDLREKIGEISGCKLRLEPRAGENYLCLDEPFSVSDGFWKCVKKVEEAVKKHQLTPRLHFLPITSEEVWLQRQVIVTQVGEITRLTEELHQLKQSLAVAQSSFY